MKRILIFAAAAGTLVPALLYAQSNPYLYQEGAVLYTQSFDSGGVITSDFGQQATGEITIEVIDYSTKQIYGGAGSASGCEDLTGTTFTADNIPAAPRTPDSSKSALRMIVNPPGSATAGAVANLYTNQTFSGDYRMKVDVFFRVNGPPDDGGTGSTEDALVGINHSGTKVVNFLQSGTATFPTDTDGYYWMQDGERGSGTVDYALMQGDPAAAESAIYSRDVVFCGDIDTTDNGGFNGDGLGSVADTQAFLNLFPYGTTRYRYRGSSGDAWMTLIIDTVQRPGGRSVTVYIKTVEDQVARMTNYIDSADTYDAGKILLGYEDRFSSEAPAEDSYVLYDNLEVVELLPPTETGGTWTLYD